ncbi:MAG: hypothetical protein JNK52_07105 [Zoogloeaceae bacterium]|nr:hypothetical protein [Zoogloeaceae bacterium]
MKRLKSKIGMRAFCFEFALPRPTPGVHLLLAAWLLAIFSSAWSGQCQHGPIVSGFESDVFYHDPRTLVEGFDGSGINTVATTIAWSVVEAQHGHVDPSPYFPALDALVERGYCLILLLDSAGRAMHSDIARKYVADLATIPESSRPGWLVEQVAELQAIDFYGGVSRSLEFENRVARDYAKVFYRGVIPALVERYGSHIVGFATCVTSECEIKYSQNGFRWESYSPLAQAAFRAYQQSLGLTPQNMPVMDFPNQLAGGLPREVEAYPVLQAFREDSLREHVCALSGVIGELGQRRIGYFGQPFAFPDGIYATGIIEKVVDCFDVAVIDYNFYNGYTVELRPEIPGFITDYALALGYAHVMVGMYAERFRDPASGTMDPRAYRVITDALGQVRPSSRILGAEVGNLTGREFSQLPDIARLVAGIRGETQPAVSGSPRVALYASIANSYLWQGEWSNERQLIQDNLLATYRALIALPGLEVVILADRHFAGEADPLAQVDVLVLPHLTTMPPGARAAIRTYIAGGGRVLADMQLDAFLPTGALQGDDSLQRQLGIAAQQAFAGAMGFRKGPQLLALPGQRQYVAGFLLAPLPGFKVAFPAFKGNGEGVILQGPASTVFGYLPLLVEGRFADWARDAFAIELRRLLTQTVPMPRNKRIHDLESMGNVGAREG